GADEFGGDGGDRMIERAGGAGRQHYHAGHGAGDPHGVGGELQRQGQEEVRDPVLQQVPVGQALEQRVPVVLVHVDEAGQDDAAPRIEDLIETVGGGRVIAGPDGGDPCAID